VELDSMERKSLSSACPTSAMVRGSSPGRKLIRFSMHLPNSFRRAALSSSEARSHHAEGAYRSSAMVVALVTVCRAGGHEPRVLYTEVEKTKSPTLRIHSCLSCS